MGCYVNPRGETKESFLMREGRAIYAGDAVIGILEVPVCLVNNGPFTAAGVAFSESELRAFRFEDGRPKKWFQVDRSKLYEVSDLAHYE